jgi:membrane protein DedA with SNARE-associated domain
MQTLFLEYITVSGPLGYFLVFLGTLIEGDAALLLVAFLARLHYINPWVAAVVILVSVVFGDACWFLLGRKYGNSDNRFARWLHKHTKTITVKFEDNFFRNYLFTKFTYGIHRFLIASLGAHSTMSFKKYIKTEIIASLVWVVVIGGVGYGFAASFILLKKYVAFAEIGFVVLLILYFWGEQVLKHLHAMFEFDL